MLVPQSRLFMENKVVFAAGSTFPFIPELVFVLSSLRHWTFDIGYSAVLF
jgi:hypothetical protein